MKKTLPVLLAIFICICIAGCGGKKKPGKDDSLIRMNTLLTDSMKVVYKDKIAFTFQETNFVYTDSLRTQISDTLGIAEYIFVNSKFGIGGEQIKDYGKISYIKNGKVCSGYVQPYDVTCAYVNSKKDSNVLYLANFTPIDSNEHRVVIRYIQDHKMVDQLSLDTPYTNITWIDLGLLDSVTLNGTNDILCVDSYYPACGYGSDFFYVDANKGKFNLMLTTFSWFDAPVYAYEDVYFPASLNTSDRLYQFRDNTVVRDTSGIPCCYMIPADIKEPYNQLVYVRNVESRDSIRNGKPVMDEYGETM